MMRCASPRSPAPSDVRVDLQIWPEMVHVWHLFHAGLKAGSRAIEAGGVPDRAGVGPCVALVPGGVKGGLEGYRGGGRSSAECCVDNTADILLGIIVPIGTKPQYGADYHYCAAARRNNAALAQRRSML